MLKTQKQVNEEIYQLEGYDVGEIDTYKVEEYVAAQRKEDLEEVKKIISDWADENTNVSGDTSFPDLIDFIKSLEIQ